MRKAHDVLFPKGSGRRAMAELSMQSHAGLSGYPWVMHAGSRLLVKHESEWVNSSKGQRLAADVFHVNPVPPASENQRSTSLNCGVHTAPRKYFREIPSSSFITRR